MVSITTGLPDGDLLERERVGPWLEAVSVDYGERGAALLLRAYDLIRAHGGERELPSGETLVRHNLAVVEILGHLKLDPETLAAGILGGVLKDPGVTLAQIRREFGDATARMVDDLARIGAVAALTGDFGANTHGDHAENLRRLLLGIAEDVRVVLVVVAEKLHLMRVARGLPDPMRRRLALETREIYAPLANRLGIWQVKWELEDLCFRFLDPDNYMRIAKQLDGRRGEREHYINRVIELLGERFAAAGIQNAQISGRPKHLYSIWRKMQRKEVPFEEIFDVRAVRVLVDTVADCYAALGIVHGLWRHIPGEFDDYIATPKANMYQSIHTAVIGPEEKPVEIQIRTFDMHHHSELGVAAHWKYKEAKGHDEEFERRIVWMRHWLELKDDAEDAGEFFERFKAEFEPVHIYVLTPQAKVIELPKGSTPLDFAYAIHTELGHRCRGARVNGRIVQLNHRLESGQTVEVLTTREGGPSRDWLSPQLGYLKTSRARNRVRAWFKRQDFDHHVGLGRTALERELHKLGLHERPDLDRLAPRYNFKKGDDVLAAIGRGDLSPVQLIGLSGIAQRQTEAPDRVTIATPRAGDERPKGEVTIDGMGDLMTTMARCCKPVPFDPIVGFITRGRGIAIHRGDCSNVRHMRERESARLVEVRWSGAQSAALYPVDILVRANDRKGLLRDLSSVFTNEEVDVTGVNTLSDRKTDTATMRFTVEIADMRQLSLVMDKLLQLPDVLEVRRKL